MGEVDDHGWSIARGRRRGRKDNNQFRIDIATARNFNKDDSNSLTTYFFSDFPESYGAKALFNAFDNYGDIMEVVIPAKRDKGGRRFGFARFDRVVNPRQFADELDAIVFGREKISVNLSRYQRPEGNKRIDHRSIGRNEEQ
ncbi:hypothetical protein L195_g059119, partial [Trifolium pratense]